MYQHSTAYSFVSCRGFVPLFYNFNKHFTRKRSFPYRIKQKPHRQRSDHFRRSHRIKMLVIEPATSIRFSSARFTRSSRLLPRYGSLFVPWNKIGSLSHCSSCTRWNKCVKNGIRASAGGLSGPLKPNKKPQRYHPSEDISDFESDETGVAVLKPAETCRTVIEVNSKALIMFAGVISDEIQDNLFWPDLPYVTDEHGNIYFQVKNDEDILQSLTSDNTPVDVIIGLDTSEMINEMESVRADIDFDDGVIDDEASDIDDDSTDDEEEDEDEDDEFTDEDWEGILEDGEDEEDSDESPGDWANLETMRSSHPLQFAKELAKFVSDDPVNYMDQPPAGLAIQGLLKPAFVEESVINKHMFEHKPNGAGADQISEVVDNKEENLSVINGHRHELGPSEGNPSSDEELQKDQNLGNGTSYYKLEIMKIRLISPHGSQTSVKREDFRRAKPDAIAHSAAKIISRVKAGGDKTTLALKSLCWRSKGIRVEEVALIGVDSLGFDLRVCSGRQVQTLRFGFHKRAYSEYSAERQLNCLLFPRTGHQQKKKEAHQSEL